MPEHISRWNTELEKLRITLQQDGQLIIHNYDDVDKLGKYLIELYNQKNDKHAKILSPASLKRMEGQAIEILGIHSPCLKRELKRQIDRHCKHVYLHQEVMSKSAPIIPIPTMMELAWRLWQATTPVQRGSSYRRKAAATAIAISCFTGNRWGDTTRLKWQDLRLSKDPQSGLIFIFFHMRVTKTGNTGTAPIWASMYQNKTYKMCPYELLHCWWRYTGRKQSGFLFPQGDTCMDSEKLFYPVRRMAIKLNMDPAPQKHTARNTLVATLFAMKVPLEEIRRRFNWTSTSEMPFRYVRHHLDRLPQSVSYGLAQRLQNNDLPAQDNFL